MRGEASGIFSCSAICDGHWGALSVSRPFLALRCDCAKFRRNISGRHFARKHRRLAHYRFFCRRSPGLMGAFLVESEFPPIFHDRGFAAATPRFLLSVCKHCPRPRWRMPLRDAQRDRIHLCFVSSQSGSAIISRCITQSTLAFFDYGSST